MKMLRDNENVARQPMTQGDLSLATRVAQLVARYCPSCVIALRLIGEHVVDFLLVLTELFFARCYSRGATSED